MSETTSATAAKKTNDAKPKYPGTRITTNGNQLVATFTESLICDAGIFYPITPSTEQGEHYQLCYAKGQLNAFGESFAAIETEGEHAAQGGAIAYSVTGKRVVNFTSGQGIVYGLEQYYHAPGKLSTMVLEVGARALTKHALNVHCGHDDIYAALDTGWIVLFAKDAQQASDQAIILRRVTELSLTPGINTQDGFLTTHLERTFRKPEPALVREFLGRPDDEIDCPTAAQKELFGATRRRVPAMIDLQNPLLLGPVQNQEHYMNGVAARRNNFSEDVLAMLEASFADFAELTGRSYGLISEYRCEDAETVFVALGCGAENLEAGVDFLRDKGESVGVLHVNVLRPFPEAAVIDALRGKKKVIVIERTDESLSGDNPLTRDLRVALAKGAENFERNAHAHVGKLDPKTEMPEIFSGVYGLGSRDFRPEGMFGAYEFVMGKTARQDGKLAADGKRFFYIGINHPYAVLSEDTPSLLPAGAIAVRLHSIGGWGMITTGKNLSEILGEFSNYIAERDQLVDENGDPKEVVHISANPKYGSEKKGAPTNYFLVAAPERIRVNCDLRHVNVVLCCDPKIFLHANPLIGLEPGGAFVWESAEPTPEATWQRIPQKYRQEIIAKKIRIFTLRGFEIAHNATNSEHLQTRMQGNAFLGAFFKVSSFLQDYKIPEDEFAATVRAQYVKKFGRLGDAVVDSNMQVMEQGFQTVSELPLGLVDALDTSARTGTSLMPVSDVLSQSAPNDKNKRAPLFRAKTFDREYRAGLGYDQPASPLASVGIMAAGTGRTSSKYVARRETPTYLAENCTQCMDCIVACPDTALPNTAQKVSTVLSTAIYNYVSDPTARTLLLKAVPNIDKNVREKMVENAADKTNTVSFAELVRAEVMALVGSSNDALTEASVTELANAIERLPMSYHKTKAIFQAKEKKAPGSGGLFSIFVSDLCKGCGACVEACGDHDALRMVTETEDIHAQHQSAVTFLDLLKDTPTEYLGLFDAESPQDSRAAALKMHLMMRSKYEALVSGDGACAGCGEKSVLRAIATLTETYMRPVFRAKRKRLNEKSDALALAGVKTLEQRKAADSASYEAFRRTILHAIMGFGGADNKDTESRIADEFSGNDQDLIAALVVVMQADAQAHREPKFISGDLDGMSVMAMAAHTGCNTVYGSTPPNNPHPYPWMNSLFQDGATIGWLIAESFTQNHARGSVIPERLADCVLNDFADGYDDDDYFTYTHFTDAYMSDLEITELPKVWVVGGDGGMGDIGFQNVTKAFLQNRPNLKMLMLDTQVYSNTGGQNSDSSPMTGGFDMNQAGAATEGKLTEMKSVSSCFLSGLGSGFIAQVSMANSANLYKAILDGLTYRGTAFYQVFTTCQPEHGVADDMSTVQALRARDSRGIPEFVQNPSLGESYLDCFSLKGNPSLDRDWTQKLIPAQRKEKYAYTVAHWAFSEARFRLHHKRVKSEADIKGMIELTEIIKRITQDDVMHRRFLDKTHRAFIPKRGVYAIDYADDGTPLYHVLSRQMVLFCIERRKNWRLHQSRAGIVNVDYAAQKEYLTSQEG